VVPSSLQVNAITLYCVMFADLVAIATTDIMYEDSRSYLLLAFCFQLFTLLATVLLLYVLLSETFLAKKGLYTELYGEFRVVTWVVPVHLTLFLIVKLYRLALEYEDTDHIEIWDQGGYRALHALQRLVGVGFHVAGLTASTNMMHMPHLFGTQGQRAAL